MDLILNNSFNFEFNISDFALDPLTSNIITTGSSLNFIKNDKIIKTLKGKLKDSQNIRFIKYSNQLFSSNDFYVVSNFKVYKVDGNKKKLINEINLEITDKFVDNIMVTSNGKIVCIANKILYVQTIGKNGIMTYPLKNLGEGIFKIYISGENIIIKHRKLHENEIDILFLNLETLKIISSIKSKTNYIFSKIVGTTYISSTENGELEIWDILDEEVKSFHQVSNYKITYIDDYEDKFILGNSNGEIIVLDSKFNIIKTFKVFSGEIRKIVIFNFKMYVLSENNKLKVFDILSEIKKEKIVENFLNEYNIDYSYKEFFTKERVLEIENFIGNLELENVDYTPKKLDIFKALNRDVKNIKVCIMGKDPYFQKGVATGLAFEVKSKSWLDENINPSLKNMLKLIYLSYESNILDIAEIRKKIKENEFKILSPDKLFEDWQNQGVLLLNSSLTTIVNKAGAHHKFWIKIISELLEYISKKNTNITYLLWGNDAQILEKYILSGKIIKHNHPAISGNLNNPKDFLNGKSFKQTKNIIKWKGEIYE